MIAVRVLQALADAPTKGALEFLTDALRRAQLEGFIRTFADAGQPLVPLLQEAARQGVTPDYVGEILAAIGTKPTASATGSLAEPLSERELEVLWLLAAGLSNSQIAKKLIVTPGTVKTHIHNIYGKLEVHNRAEFVTRARELKLI